MTVRERIGEFVHVAADGENRGRVLLRLRSGRPNALAVDMAIRIAQAYQARLESLFVEEPQIVDGALHPFVNEICLSGRTIRSLEVRDVEAIFGYESRQARRLIEARAVAAGVPFAPRRMRDESLRALSVACAENGPWNVIVLADPVLPDEPHSPLQMLTEIADATAVVVVGPRVAQCSGPIVIAVETADRLDGMLRLAERLSEVGGDTAPIDLLPVGETVAEGREIESQLRLALGADQRVRILMALATLGSSAVAVEAVRRVSPGLVIAQASGSIAGGHGDSRALAQLLDCPIILVR